MENHITIQNKIQKFINRLYSVVNDPNITDIVWSNNGTTILIPDKETFRTKSMSKISKTKEYTAFLRSLHHYNFIKLKRTDDESDEYYHRYFMQNREDILHFVRREKDRKKGIGTEIDGIKGDFVYIQSNLNALNQNLYGLNDEVLILREKVEKQEQTINGLMEILSKIFRVGIVNDPSQPALESNMNEINTLFKQCITNKNDISRRKIPKLEMRENEQYDITDLRDIDKKDRNPNKNTKKQIFKNNLALESSSRKNIEKKNQKITELRTEKQFSMPKIDHLNKNKDSNEEDDYQDLFY